MGDIGDEQHKNIPHRHSEGSRSYPPAVIRTPRALALALAALVASSAPLRAGEPSASPSGPLTVEELAGGQWPFVGPSGPSITWIPGEDAWLEWRKVPGPNPSSRPDAPVERLVRVDAVTGEVAVIVRQDELDARHGVEAPVEARGIGRRGASRLTVAADGSSVVLVGKGGVVRIALRGDPAPVSLVEKGPVSDVRISADGRRISFVRDHDLYASVIEGGTSPQAREVRLTEGGTETHRNGDLDWVYPEELDATTAAWWSGDGQRLVHLRLDESAVPRFPIGDPTPDHGATTSQFYPYAGDPNPKATMVVTGAEGEAPVELDLGLPPEVAPYAPWAAWTPDAARVVVAVLDRAQTRLELRACDPLTGRGAPIWRERSDAWVDLPPPPRALASRNAFLLKSRRDGFWRHWLVSLDGVASPRPLSSAGVDAGDLLAVDEVRGVLFHAQRTADGRHDVVRRVPLDGGDATTLLDDGFSHAVSFASTGHVFVDVASSLTSPPRTVVRSSDGKKIRVLADASTPEFRALELSAPEFLKLPAADGTPCDAMLWRPPNFDPMKRHPLLVYGYGGPGSRMVSDSWQGGNGLVRVLLDLGFLVLTVDGRGTGGHGKAFEALVHLRLGTLEAADQASAVRALAKEPFVDGTRVGIWGGSYGGFLALTARMNHPDVFRAAIALAPVTDWRLYDSIYTERYMRLPSENAEGYAASSIVGRRQALRDGVLVLHGLSDDNVHAQNTLRLVDAYLAAGVSLDWAIYPRRGHGIDGGGARLDVYRRIVRHFTRFLGSGEGIGR